MRRLDVKRTNETAILDTIQLARNALVRAMPQRSAGEWQVVVRWEATDRDKRCGCISHLEPQSFGSDAPSDPDAVAGPQPEEMRRIERAVKSVIANAVETHPYGRLAMKITWAAGRVDRIEHSICQSRKVDPISESV